MKTVNGLPIPQAVDYSNMGESFGSCADVVAAILTKAAELVGDDTADAATIAIGTTYGLKVGTAAAQKIGFHGVTPVIQGTSCGAITITGSSLSTAADTAALKTAILAINTALYNKGLVGA